MTLTRHQIAIPAYTLSLLALAFGLAACAGKTTLATGDAGPDARMRTGRYDECGNGMDDDGDGQIDEDCFCGGGESQSCFTGIYPNRGVGACADGVQACDATSTMEFGHWGACTMDTLPADEACDGVDNDCDGAIDEGCPCTAGQTQGCGSEFAIAPCSAGRQTCQTDGTWSACEGAIGPSAEVCGDGAGDGIDNDCDGLTDEGCDCVAEPEVCSDAVDNDCDGEVDEASCTNSMTLPDGCVADSVEICGDLIDNNCDGTVDEPACSLSSPLDGGMDATLDGGSCATRFSHAVSITGSLQRMCARIDDGSVYCWGSNYVGGLGVGEGSAPETSTEGRDYALSATRVPRVTSATMLTSGNESSICVIESGAVKCWGREAGAYHPDSSMPLHWANVLYTPARPEALTLAGVDEVIAGVAPGHAGGVLRTASGKVWRWGQLGALAMRGAAVRVPIDNAIDVAFYGRTICVVREDHTVWCFGKGQEGIVGPPPSGRGYRGFFQPDPTRIEGLSDIVDVQVGDVFACALHGTGEVSCWGLNGTRGNGDIMGSDVGAPADLTPTPELVEGLSNVRRLVAGRNSSCAVKVDGSLWCWGSYYNWRAPEFSRPVQIMGVSDVVDVAVGSVVGVAPDLGSSLLMGELCVLERCGRVLCWGTGLWGLHGNGRPVLGSSGRAGRAPTTTPVEVVGLP
ncbi:MAG: hypothetical protein GXP55_23005 [Deltaproteobacteria bacterium]|nr:hypothetical protein [Deltaproteobacteria bacterium]